MSSRREFLKLLGVGAAVTPFAPLFPPTRVSGPAEPPPVVPPPNIVGHAQIHDGGLCTDNGVLGPGYAWDGNVFIQKQGPWPALPRRYASYTPLCTGK